MKITIKVDETSSVFFQLRDMWEKSIVKGETLEDYIADYVREVALHDDKVLDEAHYYLEEHGKTILEKHPEDAIHIVDYLED